MRDEEDNTSIDVSFMSLLLDLEYDEDDEACTVGATYKQIYRIGYQLDLGKRQMKLWVGFCNYLPLSQEMATQLISSLVDRERETKEAKRLIEEALIESPEVFEALNAEDPDNVTFGGDQITPSMSKVIEVLIDLGKEDYVSKESVVAKMYHLYGYSAHSVNGLLHQLKMGG